MCPPPHLSFTTMAWPLPWHRSTCACVHISTESSRRTHHAWMISSGQKLTKRGEEGSEGGRLEQRGSAVHTEKGECSRGLLNDRYRRWPSGMNTLLTYQYLCKLIPQRFSSPKCKINPAEMLGNDVLPLVLGCTMISISSVWALGA